MIITQNEMMARSSKAFLGSVSQVQVASENGHIQLYNSGTGIIQVNSGSVYVAAAGVVNMYFYNTTLTTLATSYNAYEGAATGNGKIRRRTNVGVLGTILLKTRRCLADTPVEYLKKNPIILPPNKGLMFAAGTVNVTIAADFEWLEF